MSQPKGHSSFFIRFLDPPAPCAHALDTFFLLIPAGAVMKSAEVIFSRLAWSSQFERYSFIVDHLKTICAFLFYIIVALAAFAAARLALERALRAVDRRPSRMDAPDRGARGRQKKALAVFMHALGAAYAVTIAVLVGNLALQCVFTYSPILYNAFYALERFAYPLSTLIIAAAFGIVGAILSRLLIKNRRLRRISASLALATLFQTLSAACLIASADIALVRFAGIDLTLAAEWLMAAICLYAAVGLLRGVIQAIFRGDPTGSYVYPPLMRLPEYIALFDRSVSWEARTGLSFKSLWCARYALRLIPVVVLSGLLLLFASTCVYTIEPHQEALVYRLGSLRDDSVKAAGLHLKFPYPIETVDIYDVSRVRSLQVGYAPSDSRDNLWTSAHGGEEYALLLGEGNELIAMNLRVAYHIVNLRDYVTRYVHPEGLLASKVFELVMRKSAVSTLNTMLSVDRSDLSNQLHAALTRYADEAGLGVAINEVIVESIHPPVDVASVYQGVVSAGIQKEAIILKAQGDAAQKINGAKHQAETIVLSSRAAQLTRLAQATSDMAVYGNAFLACEASPECYVLRKRTDTYQKLIAGMRVYVFSKGTADDRSRFLITNGMAANSLTMSAAADAAAGGK